MIRLHSELRSAGFPTFIFTNTNELAVRYIRRTYPFFAGFTDYIFSYEHGLMKPDPKLYQVVESKSGHCGPAILYIDDRLENVETGSQRGWQTILHENAETTGSRLSTLCGLPARLSQE
jgi:HAD superfamily hydrolase (TIGR01509 family)